MTRRQYGSDPDGGFNSESKAYKADPTIARYVELRRANPSAEVEVAVIGGFESMFYMREEFERFGLDPELLGGILDADPQDISETCLRILEELIKTHELSKSGETHLISRGRAIPDKLIDWIICCALDSLSWNDDLTIPRDMIVLIRERLGGSDLQYEKIGRVRTLKSNAAMIAGQLKAQGINPTFKLIGELLSVAPSTVMRWFEPGEFEQDSDVWSRHFDETGKLRPIHPTSVASEP